MSSRNRFENPVTIDAGAVIGRWTVTDTAFVGRYRKVACVCACGTQRLVISHSLKWGHTRSCGCTKQSHGESKGPRSISTGRRSSPEYRVWMGLIARCSTHPEYAGRGIMVCERWKNSFVLFLSDMGRRPSSIHSMDRIDNNGDYSPENCRWATRTQQNRNVRTNQIVTRDGESKCVSEWAEQLGISAKTIYTRIARGHDPFVTQRKRRVV